MEEISFRLREMTLSWNNAVSSKRDTHFLDGQGQAEPSRAGPSQPEQSQAELGIRLSLAKPSPDGPGRAEARRAGPGRTELSRAEQGRAEPG